MRRLTHCLLALAAACALATAAAPAASAAPTWNCEASPLHARLLGLDLTLGLLTSNANGPRCRDDSRGIGALTGGLPVGLAAGALNSSTSLTGPSGTTSAQRATASANVANVRLSVTGLISLLRVDAATSSATASCVSGAPSLTATSTIGNVYLGGVRVVGLDRPVTITGNVVNGLPVGVVAQLIPNEQTIVNGVLTRNALHVTIGNVLGGSLIDATVAQSIVSATGAVCDTTTERRPSVAVVDSGRNRVVAATVTPPEGRTITGCVVTAPVRVTGSYDAATGRCTATLPRADVPAGTYPVTVEATDSAGQTGSGSGSITITNPSVGSPAVADRAITAAVTPPAGATIAACEFSITSTTIPGIYDASARVCRATLPDSVPEGTATATARATDSNGDVGTATATVTVGAVPPGPAVTLVDSGENRTVVARLAPGTGRTVTACTLAVRDADSTGGYTTLPSRLGDGGTTCTATLPRGDYDPGAYEVRATATDDAGRTGSATGPVTVGAPAVGAPTADDRDLRATLAPAAGTPVEACAFVLSPVGGGADVTVDGTVSASGAVCTATAPASVATGTYVVTATARDANGDTGRADAELLVGTPAPPATPPTVTLTDSAINRVVTANVTPSDGDAITACAIGVRAAGADDGTPLTPLDATYDAARGTCSATLGTAAFPAGSYEVVVSATDSSGDGATDRGTVRVVAPDVGAPAADGRTITATVDPAPGTPLVSCRIEVDPAGPTAPVTIAGALSDGTCTATLPDGVIDPGEATATVTITDANGDTGSRTAGVTIGAVPRPAVQIVPADNRAVVAEVTPPPGRTIDSCTIEARPAGSNDYTLLDAQYDASTGHCTAALPRDTYGPGAYEVRVHATDDAGRTGEATGAVEVRVPDVSTPAISGRTVTTTATAPEGTTLASCRFVLTPTGGGGATTLDGTLDAATGTCRATLPDAVGSGAYSVEATVTDDAGDAGTATGTGTVGAVPAGPAVALSDSATNRTVVATIAPGADPDVRSCTLEARPAGSGGTFTALADAALSDDGTTCTATLPRDTYGPGAYEVRATATDASDRTGSASGTIMTSAPSVGTPTANEREIAAPVTPAPGVAIDTCKITLTPANTDNNPETTMLDGRYDAATASCVVTAPAAVADGAYIATVTATDANGDGGSASGEIRVGAPPVAATPPTVTLADSGRNRVVQANASAPSGETITACVLRARNDQGNLVVLDATYDAAAGTCTATLPATAFGAGSHDVDATVTDSTGDAASASGIITIAGPEVGTPVIDGHDVATPVTPAPGTPVVSCTVTVTPQSGGTATTISGTVAPDGTCTATIPDTVTPGTADVTVDVTDGNGDTDTGTGTVVVPAPVSSTDTGGGGGTGGSGTGSGTGGGAPSSSPSPVTGGSVPSSGGVFATGNTRDILLSCGNGRLLLTDVVIASGRVRLTGVAAQQYVGKVVTLKFSATGKKVATAKVAANGRFTARAKLPAKKLRTSDRARYQAVIGTLASPKLKLTRRTYVSKIAQAAGNRVELRGTVTKPRARTRATITVQRLVSCKKYETVGSVKLSSSGKFVARVARPGGANAALYRVMTKVPSKPGGKATNKTYSLLGGIDLK
ncbi:beta strand repeat-containing protein [Baekduia sp. Peel2402]|uniref:beta strand repeat-containing protein n=1 Tax=Baekduia sp. Peel2402 TaxID=3458296 RepID=UPI00403EB905